MRRLLIQDLLVKPESVTINTGTNDITLWVRPASSPERTMAAAYSRKESRKMRKLFSNKKSEEYRTVIQSELEDGDRDALEKIWINGKLIPKILEMRTRSLEERDYIPEPEGEQVTNKQLDEYEDAVDEAEETREEQLAKAIEAASIALKEEASKIPIKELKTVAEGPLIDAKAQEAAELEFVARLIMMCTFEDEACKRPAFENIEQVYQLKHHALTKLTNAHMGLLYDPEEIKN